ncbi:ABC transporter substrate-binding protein [Rubrobacter naiadicus]|uniref:ABC transporter substrate-binding protein n=1 Tax=Rubrobacter naiadicus TaxID=1392641 RepID=UPI00235DEF47|nr:ABC transporter substrate-binding protein [Rubrobacter naiadicus]
MRTRKVSRGRFLALSGGALASVALAGCGSGSGGVQQASGNLPKEAKGRTVVVLWSSYSDVLGKALQSLVDKFNGSQKDVYVQNQFQGSYEQTAQKLAQALQAKKIPDISLLSDVNWTRFYLNGNLEPLDGYFGKGFSRDDYLTPFRKEGTKNGKLYWVPFARSTPLLYYNKEMFRKAGLPDRGPKTWSELQDWGRELVKLPAKPKAFAFTTADNYNAWYFQNNVWDWGGAYSNDKLDILIDKDGAVAAGEFVRAFCNKYGLGYMAKNQTADFANGQTAMTEDSSGDLTTILQSAKFDVGASFLPAEKDFGCPTGGAGLSILSSIPEERKKAAFEFIKFLGQPENVSFWTKKTGYLPVTNSAIASSEMRDYLKKNPLFKVAVEQLPKTRPQDLARTIIPNGDQIIGKGIENIIDNNQPAKTAFASVAQQLESAGKSVKSQLAKAGG